MLKETLEMLAVKSGGMYLDATGGAGNYSQVILSKAGENGRLFIIDTDPDAIELLKTRFAGISNVTIIKANFNSLHDIIAETGCGKIDGITLDLGLSSMSIDDRTRGMAYKYDGPLDMRFDRSQGKTAADIIAEYTLEQLAIVLRKYGEISHSYGIASALKDSVPKDMKKLRASVINFTKKEKPEKALSQICQALRIEVNGEMDSLAQCLDALPKVLNPGGRAVIVSYHSLEDRMVKEFFAIHSAVCVCPPEFPVCVCGKKPEFRLLTKSAVKACEEEIKSNPRSRSARMRAVEMI